MRLQSRYSDVVLNLLVAVAISLVVNFSYLLLLLVEQSSEAPPRSAGEQIAERRDAGTLFVHPDGYGYLIYANGDSVYTPSRRMRWLGLEAGDRIVADLMPPRNAGGHPVLERVRTLNDAEYDYSALYNRTSRWTELLLQLVFYLIMSFVMLSILTSSRRNYSMARYVRRCLWCIAAAVGLYCVAPVTEWHSGRIVMTFMGGRMFDYMLTTRYNLLVGQINPHFFFNSLNSLAMLVRERQDDKALVYIDQLSYTFRYIIQNGQSTLMTLGEELKFAEAYSYLFKIRYADKLFFDIAVDARYFDWRLPALSLQPLIGNAVKHNTITRSNPLHVSIRVENGILEVSNPRRPKLEPEPSTGIGLENLRNRWQLITGRDIAILSTEERFTVRLPLLDPDKP